MTISKALSNLSQGLFGFAKQQEELDALKTYQAQSLLVDKMKIEIEKDQLAFDKKKMVVDLLPSFMGEEGITPKRKDAISKSILDQTGFDISEFFRPETDDEGVVNTFMLHDKESINNKLDAESNLITAKAAKVNAAANMLKAKTDEEELKSGGFPKDAAAGIEKALWGDPGFHKLSRGAKIDEISKAMFKLDAAMSERQAMESGTKKAIEINMYESMKKIDDTKRVADTYSKEYLTWPGKFKNWTLDKILKAGQSVENIYNLSEEDRQFVRGFADFHASINRIFVQFVHDMSGAQYSVKEMETHKKSLFNADQNYEAFTQVYNSFVADMKKGYRLRRKLLQEGFTGDKGALGKEIHKLYMLPQDPTQNMESISKRIDELNIIIGDKPTLEKEDLIYDTLVSEGYVI